MSNAKRDPTGPSVYYEHLNETCQTIFIKNTRCLRESRETNAISLSDHLEPTVTAITTLASLSERSLGSHQLSNWPMVLNEQIKDLVTHYSAEAADQELSLIVNSQVQDKESWEKARSSPEVAVVQSVLGTLLAKRYLNFRKIRALSLALIQMSKPSDATQSSDGLQIDPSVLYGTVALKMELDGRFLQELGKAWQEIQGVSFPSTARETQGGEKQENLTPLNLFLAGWKIQTADSLSK